MLKPIKIKSIKSIGVQDSYDVKDVGGNHLYVGPHNIIVHNCLDELSAADNKTAQFSTRRVELTKVFKVYTETISRIISRFMDKGILPLISKLFMIQQVEEDVASFLDNYIEMVKDEEHVLIYNDPIWRIKRKAYSGITFTIACGTEYHPPKIIEKGEDISVYVREGHAILNDCPVELKRLAKLDLSTFLKRQAGILARHSVRKRLIPQRTYVSKAVRREYEAHPFTKEYLVLDYKNKQQKIQDYFIFNKLEDITAARYIHTDLSKSGNELGMAMVRKRGMVNTVKVNIDTGQVKEIQAPGLYLDFALQIRPPYDSKIPIYKIREFYFWLRKKGVNIVRGTFDQFQSEESIQSMVLGGIPSSLLSVDRNDVQYKSLRDCILEERVDIYDYEVLVMELGDLLHDTEKGKVYPPEKNLKGEIGDKGVADAFCGACWNALVDTVSNPRILLDTFKSVLEKQKDERDHNRKGIINEDLAWLFSK